MLQLLDDQHRLEQNLGVLDYNASRLIINGRLPTAFSVTRVDLILGY